MPTDRLLFVTSNPGKVREAEAILGHPIEQLALDLPEIQALDVDEVVREKARAAFAVANRPVMVEDTGLSIDALRGLPGALVRWFLLTIGTAGIAALIPSGVARGARATTAVAVCDGTTVDVFVGETAGEIVLHPAGEAGFGWDSLFRPTGATRTFAQMDLPEKNVFSMRRQALLQLRDHLRQG